MDHFTSPAPCRRNETQARSRTRRSFLGDVVLGVVGLKTMALPAPGIDRDGPPFPRVVTAMEGAEYVALLGGAAREPVDGYVEKRWREIAAGPLIDAIDSRALVVCPRCLFVSYTFVPCQICLQRIMADPDEVAAYLAILRKNYEDLPQTIEESLTEQRIERAVDLFDGPESAEHWGQTLFIRDMLRSGEA